jgi:hypothetical protein
MKKITLTSRFALIILLLAIFSKTASGQPAHNFTLTPQSLCFGTGSNTAMAGLTSTMSGATGYQWSATGSCTPTISNFTAMSTQVYFPCCGNFTITSTAFSGSTVIAVISKTIAIHCTNFLSVSGATTLCSGTSKTLTASGANSYTWSNGSLFASTVVSPTVSTCYTVNGTNSVGCVGSAVVCLTVTPGVNILGNLNICAGSSTTLTATGSNGYTWSPGNQTGSVLVVSPSVTTCYAAQATSTPGCNSMDSVCVNVSPGLNISVTGNSVACSGNVLLSASGASTYTWQPGNLTGTNVSPNVTSNTCFTVTGSSPGCNNAFAIKCVTVLPTPTVSISGNTNLCPGSTATLTASGANSYSWTGPFNTTVNPIVFTPTATTCFSVMGTNSLGCTGWSGTCVTVGGPSISISGPNFVCLGNSATLTGTGGQSYTWSPGFGSGGSMIITPTATTCYTLTASNGTCTGSAVKCVSVQSAPVVSSGMSANPACAGSSVTLIGSLANTYTWLPFNITGSVVAVTLTASGCYTVIGANTAGCTGTSVNCYTVIPSPTVAISGPSVICAGNSATLSGSGATSYTWKPSQSTATSIVVTPTTSTCYTLVGSNGSCSVSAIKCLTVQPTNIFISGNNVVCAGASATLTAFGSSNYTWSPGNQTTNSIVITPTATSCYSVQSIVSSCTATGVKCVTVQPLPVISAAPSSSLSCAGTAVTLNATGANTYTWSPFNQTGPSIVVSPTTNVCYTVSGTASGCVGSATGCMTVQPLPSLSVTGNNSICAGSSATLTGNGAVTYTWFPGNLTGSVVVVSPVTTSCYTLVGTNSSGCVNSTIRCVTVQPTNISVSGNSIICQGASGVLTASGSASYTWLPGGATGNSVAISPSVSTCYTVLGNSNGCSTSGIKCVTVQANPIISSSVNSSVLCSGSSYVFSASGATTYTWLPFNQTGSQMTQTVTTGMCYTVIGMVSPGCTGSAVNCFSVNPTPTLSITGPTSAICTGSGATLTASGASGYTWFPSNSNGTSIVVTPTSSTCYSLIGSSAGCNSSAVKCLTVQPSTVAVTGVSVICQGSSATLTAPGSSSYTWFPGSLTGSVVVVSPTASVCYTVLGTSSSGCNSSGVKCISVIANPVISISGSNSLCSGKSYTLGASGALTYSWMPFSMSGSVIAITPTTSTCYTVTGTGSGGCKGTAVSCYSILPSPTITISGNAPICQGESLTLTAGGASSYNWLPGSLSGASVSVTPTASSCYTVVGTDANGCTNSAVSCVTLSPQSPLSITGNSNICKGNSTSFVVSGASTYTWNTGSNSSTISVSPTVTSCYSVSGTGSTGCIRSATACVNVFSNPVLSVSGNTSVCSGQTSVLHANGASTYTWSTGATSPSIAVTPNSTTSYTVNGNSAMGCPGTATVTVNVNGFPYIFVAPYDSVICFGESANISVSGAQTYSWNNGALTGTLIVAPAVTTTYVVTGTSGVCHRSANVVVIVETCTGLDDINGLAGVDVFPNPTSGLVTVKNNNATTVQFSLFDLTGRKIIDGQFGPAKTIDLSGLTNGVYILRFENETGVSHQRLILEK